jgi:hypothetical protein
MYQGAMRTTIEMKPEHRARLIEIAARRGEKGFSSVIAEAVDSYLAASDRGASERRKALRRRGSLSASSAAHLRQAVQRLREDWR